MGNRLAPALLDKRLKRLGIHGAVADKIRAAERCFIVGMGPSIAKVDAAALKDELVIGVNHILRTHIRPDLICVSDASRVDTANVGPQTPKMIVARHVYRAHADLMAQADVYYDIDFASLKTSVLQIKGFEPHLKKIYWTASVIGDLAVPLAVYLGLSDAYVLGLDGARASFPVTHAWGVDRVVGPHDSKLFHLHERAVLLAGQAGLRVHNASFGGVVAAFPKMALAEALPGAVLRQPETDPAGRFLIFRGRLLRIDPAPDGSGLWRLVATDTGAVLRHKKSTAALEKDNGSPEFLADSRFGIEPGFTRRDWYALSLPDGSNYVCRWDEKGTWLVRGPEDLFSP